MNIAVRRLCWLAAILLLIRLIFVFVMGLMPQDAYYDFYGEHLALSYYDHPPMIAYLLRLATTVFGKKVFALKLADTLITLLTVLSFYHLALRFLSVRKAQYAVLLLLSTLMITILSLISTPDVPMVLCWTLSLLALHRALFDQKHVYWIWSGILTGLCFDSKYTAVLLIAGLVLFLILSHRYRKLLISRWFFLYLFFFALTILPVVVWNAQNGFASFKFQSAGRVESAGGFQISFSDFAGVLGHQAAILMPILFFSLFYLLWKTAAKYGIRVFSIPDDKLFLLSFFIPTFSGFLLISFFYWVKINWMMPAYITGIIWASTYWNKKWIRYQLVLSLVVHIALCLEILFYIIPINSDDTWVGWADFSRQVKTIRTGYPGAFIFSADDYKTAAVLNFYLPEMVYSKNIVGQKALQFDFVGSDLSRLRGKDALFIDSNPRFDSLGNENHIPPSYYSYFDSIIPLSPILIRKNEKVIRKFSLFLCRHYHPDTLSRSFPNTADSVRVQTQKID
jgi:Dolichyl-phosphate-mannose-protein mannosyltransferase